MAETAAEPLSAEQKPQRKRSPWRSALFVLGALGPGLITASAGNDVGGIATYSLAGAQYGYKILWVMVPLTVSLIVVQEMSGRMAAVTGKGLASLIREEFGVRITLLTILALIFVNTFITASEFAGIASAADIFHVSRYIAVPVSLGLVFAMVLRFDAKVIERVFLFFSAVYLCYIGSAILAKPDWGEVGRGLVIPTIEWHDTGFLLMIVGLIGTTISPYMQFFLQSSIVEKDARPKDLPAVRADIISGSVLAIVVAAFMIIANAATIYVVSQHTGKPPNIQQASDVAVALKPIVGQFASGLFAFGILSAGLFTATVLPLSTSYVVCEALGFEASLDRKFSEAPVFFSLLAFGLIFGAAVVLIPGMPLLQLIFLSQVVQGLVLPLELVLIMILINRSKVMGRYVNTRTGNILGWGTAVVIGVLAVVYVVQQIISGGASS
jgi:NRAMP (natural resistance-associated macrophage protein)-like metal ion transporter